MADNGPSPQVKICGLTDPRQAAGCAELGADAIGLIFYPKSPRFVSRSQALEIDRALPENVARIGVFVDEPFDAVVETASECGLAGVQLHGRETPEFVERLAEKGLIVIKGLFARKPPLLSEAPSFKASAFLLECGKGKLPGGNAMVWNWSQGLEFAKNRPTVLAGGLAPENVLKAVEECLPDAVDVSSGVESAPGDKDLQRVRAFVEAVRGASRFYIESGRTPRIVFPKSPCR